jgi:hypothetical protein
MSTPLTDSMIHRAKVQYSNSATGEIQVIIPSVTSKTGVVPITMWGRESHAANSKWLVPDVGDTLVVCREDEDYTNVFWINTTVPPDPPYTFVDTPGVDGDKTTHFGTMLQVETGNLGQVRVNTSTNVGGAALVVQPWGTAGTGLYVNPSNNATTNRAAIQLGSSLRMGTGGTTSTLGDWYIYDETATKYNLFHTGHSNTTTGGLTIRSTGLSERYLQLLPAYVSGGSEYSTIFRDNANANILMNGTLRPYSILPYVGSTYDLGSAGIQWSQIYLVNNPIVSSDQNYKTDIVDSNLGLDFVNDLRPVSFKLTHTDGREGVRTHYGLIAQEVESVLGDDASDTAIWTKETIEASPEVPADEYLPGQPAVEEHEKQGLRYDELISPMIKAIQELTTRLTALESA